MSKQAAGLVLPTGYAFNLDGTSIYMSMGVIFLANAYDVPLDFGQQLGIPGIMLLTFKGAATVTGGSFVVFAATVTATGVLPVEGLAVLFGVYRFMSIAIATTNVIGNSVATLITAKICGEFDEAQSRIAYAHKTEDEAEITLSLLISRRHKPCIIWRPATSGRLSFGGSRCRRTRLMDCTACIPIWCRPWTIRGT